MMALRSILVFLLLALVSCSGGGASNGQAEGDTAAAPAEAAPPPPAYEQSLPPALRAVADRPFTGDLDAMLARRVIRVAAPFNRTYYFIDQGTQRGLSS